MNTQPTGENRLHDAIDALKLQISALSAQLSDVYKVVLHNKAMLSLPEAANYLAVSEAHLYKLTSRKQIPFYKPNAKKIYFDKSELDQWLRRNKTESQTNLEAKAVSHLLKKGDKHHGQA